MLLIVSMSYHKDIHTYGSFIQNSKEIPIIPINKWLDSERYILFYSALKKNKFRNLQKTNGFVKYINKTQKDKKSHVLSHVWIMCGS